MEPVFLTLDEVLAINVDQVSRYGGTAGVRDEGLLLSALAMPQTGFGDEYAHRDLFEMPAATRIARSTHAAAVALSSVTERRGERRRSERGGSFTVRRVVSRVILLLTLAAVLIALAGCTSAPQTSAGGDATGKPATTAAAPTLTRETLPTAVGTTWAVVHSDAETPIDLKVEGPWKFTAGDGWRTDEHELVDPKTVPGIEKFSDVTFVDKVVGEPETMYYVRRVSDQWVDHLGKITVQGDTVKPEPVDSPQHFWPLDLKVGESYDVGDTGTYTIKATVLSRNVADVPAGRIDNAYLVRFEYTPKSADGKASTYYYMFAPDVGFVALIHPGAGDENTGFTSAEQLDVISALPSK